MAVDFSLLPVEIPETDKPPSRLIWIVVFLLLVLAGIFTVLILWPKSLPTRTVDFLGTLILFPVGIPALIVLFRYQYHAARILDTQMSNSATRQYNDRVFAAASVPLAVLGTSHRFSVVQKENSIADIRSGYLRLAVQELFARDSEPAKVRWLEVPGVRLRAGTDRDDSARQIEVTRWLFREMLLDLSDAINALPGQTNFSVQLVISGMLSDAQNEELWQECWNGFGFCSTYPIEHAAETTSLQLIDAWLDQIAAGRQREANLIVAIQLHPLLGGSPPTGTAEAGVAMLLTPDGLASRHGLLRMANLHRPVRGPFDLSNDAMMHALKWAGSTVDAISGGWRTGLDMVQAGVLRKSAAQAGLDIQPVDLDPSVGHAGIAAPWLALACAATSVSATAPRQIVFAGHTEGVDCTVLRNASEEDRSAFPASGGGAPVSEKMQQQRRF
ncbi:hypothetical protein [Paraburkholderia sacchari]|uniref:hypothetical protein n=1 Tax=Paraburkholderia sacchari TaxID=159450 RepID=UPI003D95754F